MKVTYIRFYNKSKNELLAELDELNYINEINLILDEEITHFQAKYIHYIDKLEKQLLGWYRYNKKTLFQNIC